MRHIFCLAVITAIFISTVLNLFISCRNSIESENNTVNISIETDENIDVKCDGIDVKVGSKWKSIKKRVIGCVQCKKGYKIDKLMLRNDDQDLVIRSNFAFEEDASIYVISKRGSEKENAEDSVDSEDKICIEIRGDKHINIENDELMIDKGCTWGSIRKEIIGRLEFETGYRLNKVRLTSSRGRTLYNDYVFKKDVTVYVISKQEKKPQPFPQPENSVVINLKGDENVILEYNLLEVPKCIKWKDIKDTEYIQSTSAKAGFYLSSWHLTEDVNSPVIEDEYQFCKKTDIFVFAISNDDNSDEPPEYQYIEVKPPNDEIMIDILPESEGISCSSIDYLVPNVVDSFTEKLWLGVFPNDKTVYIAPFKMAKYELTYRIWEETRKWAMVHGYSFLNDGWKGDSNTEGVSDMHPVTHISWCDAIVWCNAHTEKLNGNTSACVYLNAENNLPLKDAKSILVWTTSGSVQIPSVNLKIEKRKKGYRLPTEEEWEYAARKEGMKSNNTDDAGKTLFFTKLHSASGAKCEIASRKTRSQRFSFMKKELEETTVCLQYFSGFSYEYFVPRILSTKPIGTKRSNYLGFHDMSGNISEFSCNLAEEEIFGRKKNEGIFCVVRGGAWANLSHECTVGRRKSVGIKEATEYIGIRLCCSK